MSVPAAVVAEFNTATLVRTASAPFRNVDPFAYHFARSKLRRDPVFVFLLQEGLLSDARRILDLGCGQGLLPAWLVAARGLYLTGSWPSGWLPAPAPISLHGIDVRAREIGRAQRALAGRATFAQGDITKTDFGGADAIVMLDVLHYLSFGDQVRVIAKARASLRPGGRLVLRVADASAGIRFRYGRRVDRARLLLGGHLRIKLCCRTIAGWQALLAQQGLDSVAVPMSRGTLFANVMLIAHPI